MRTSEESGNEHSPVIRFQGDNTFQQNRDVLEGLTFVATLQLRTPLAVLQHHGNFHPGPPSAAPKYASPADGFWCYKTKSWSALAGRSLSLPEESECSIASDIGPIEPNKYLPFLKAFREIVEGNDSIDQKLSRLLNLRVANSKFSEIWCRLEKVYPDFPRSFFYLKLTLIPGIGAKMAQRLFQYGFKDIADVQNATDAELKRVPGLGSKLISRIRDYHPIESGGGDIGAA
jgi:hypothetical protein